MKSIATKIGITVVATTILVAGAIGGASLVNMNTQRAESLQTMQSALRADYDRIIRYQIETAMSVIRGVYERQQRGDLSDPDARTLAADLVRDLRYGEEGYFWIDTYDGVNVAILGNASEGTNRWSLQDVQGNYIVQDIIAAARRPGGRYTDYWFPLPGGDEALQKREYSLAFEPWQWVVGTGNYIDDRIADSTDNEIAGADSKPVSYGVSEELSIEARGNVALGA